MIIGQKAGQRFSKSNLALQRRSALPVLAHGGCGGNTCASSPLSVGGLGIAFNGSSSRLPYYFFPAPPYTNPAYSFL